MWIVPGFFINFLFFQYLPESCFTTRTGIFRILWIAKTPVLISAFLLIAILVPYGKIIKILTPIFFTLSTELIICLIDLNPLSLSIKIKPSLLKYDEMKGIFFNSFFKMNTDLLKKKLKKNVSQADWWLLASKKILFFGIFSMPAIS